MGSVASKEIQPIVALIEKGNEVKPKEVDLGKNTKEKESLEKKLIKEDDPSIKTEYDMVVYFPSVDCFTTGFASVSLSKQLKEIIKPIENVDQKWAQIIPDFQKYTTICYIGSFKKGKTFFINLLSDGRFYLPSGDNLQTKGLSIAVSQSNHIIHIDSEGTNNSMVNNTTSNKNGANDSKIEDENRENLARKKATELFIQDVAIQMSNVIVNVIGELTWPDQQNIMVLQRELKEYGTGKELYVIHNYQKVSTLKQLLETIKRYCDVSFDGHMSREFMNGGSSIDDLIVYWAENSNQTTHFFLCDDKSPFGKKWNRLCADKINLCIKSKNGYQCNNTFQNVFSDTLTAKLKNYCKSPQELTISEYNPNNNNNTSDNISYGLIKKEFVKQSFGGESSNSDIKANQKAVLKTVTEMYNSSKPFSDDDKVEPTFIIEPLNKENRETNYDLKNKQLEIRDFQFITIGGHFRPKYDIVVHKESKIFSIIFELPQFTMKELKYEFGYEGCYTVLRIEGSRKLKYNSTEEYPSEHVELACVPNPRKCGSFREVIKIPVQYERKSIPTLENGILTFNLKYEDLNDIKTDNLDNRITLE